MQNKILLWGWPISRVSSPPSLCVFGDWAYSAFWDREKGVEFSCGGSRRHLVRRRQWSDGVGAGGQSTR